MAVNLLTNGDFAANTAPWQAIMLTSFTWQSPGEAVAVVPANTSTDPFGHYIYQLINLPGPGDFRVRFRAKASQPFTLTVGMQAVVAVNITTVMTSHDVVLRGVPGPAAPGVAFILGLSGVNANLTVTFDDISLEWIPTATVVVAATPLEPTTLTVTGATAGEVFTVVRVLANGITQKVSGQLIANASGEATLVDRLYPLDDRWHYELRDSTGKVVVALSEVVGPVPSGGNPWITDTMFPEFLNVPVWIVDVSSRLRPGRVSTYSVVGRKYALTAGDIRSGSNGILTLLTRNHAERDKVIDTMSSGNPCQLRVPGECRSIVDEMVFTPRDIDEVRWGTRGASTLSVDFVEVDLSDVPPFKAVTYATQKANAASANLSYAGLRDAFVGYTYRDLYLSATGVAP